MKPNKQEKGKNRKSGMISIFAGIGSLILCVIIVAATGWLFYALPIFGVISIIGGFANLKGYTKEDLKKREQALEMERQQSIKRMQNPQYVEQLRSIGYLAPAAPMYSSQPVQQPVYQQQYACRNCGAPLDAGDRFCSRCGATN